MKSSDFLYTENNNDLVKKDFINKKNEIKSSESTSNEAEIEKETETK